MDKLSNMDKARSVALVDESDERHEDVEHKGAVYRVRPLSLKDQGSAKRMATDTKTKAVNEYAHGVAMVILGTFDPEKGEPIFKSSDLETLMAKRSNTLLAKLLKATSRVNAVESVEEAAGNSDSDPTGESSSA